MMSLRLFMMSRFDSPNNGATWAPRGEVMERLVQEGEVFGPIWSRIFPTRGPRGTRGRAARRLDQRGDGR